MIEISHNSQVLSLAVRGEYRDKEWSDTFGDVQSLLSEKRDGVCGITTFAIDLSECTWADPVPLLATILTAAQFRISGGVVDVYIPYESGSTSNLSRFAKFLAQEGFLHQCTVWKLNLCDPRQEALGDEAISFLRDHPIELAYQNASCVPAEILSLSNQLSVEEACERLASLPSLDLVVRERVPAWAMDRVRYKLYQVLFETMCNVFEHAYDQDKEKLCGIYVRYRSGLLGLPQDQQSDGHAQLKSEHASCPRLDREFLDTSFGAFEVFVIDAGRGLVKSLSDLDPSVLDEEKTGKYPFQWMSQYVFGQPVAKRKMSKATQYGGLYLIHKLLSTDRDYVRGFDDRTWIGDFVPATGRSQHILTDSTYRGLVWHFRLGWKAKTDIGDKWHSSDEARSKDVMDALCDDNTLREKTRDWWYLDQRFCHGLVSERGTFEAAADTTLPRQVLWFVPPGLTKSDIYNKLEKQVLAAALPRQSAPGDDATTLFVVDIPTHEAETYLAAFDGAEVPVTMFSWPTKVRAVVLLSRHFGHCGLKVQWSGAGAKEAVVKFLCDQNFYAKSVDTKIGDLVIKHPFSPIHSFRDLVRWIKWHDSERFWTALSAQSGLLSYITDSVSWAIGTGKQAVKLRGYLDFSQALTEPLCREILRHVAMRLPGVARQPSVRVEPLDSLTSTLADDLRWSDIAFSSMDRKAVPSHNSTSSVALGSVFVTGSTERSIVPADGQLVVHYFKHPEAGSTRKPHLLYWPKADNDWFNGLFCPSGLKDLKRIGTTAAIAERGWKYFELPRYDTHGKLIAARSPRGTYADWQQTSPVILKTGHWVYGGQHDLLTVNLALALRESFHRFSEMGCFLFFNMFKLLGITRESLNEEGQIWWERIFDQQNGWLSRVSEYISPTQCTVQKVGVVVYPSHHNTELMVDKFLSLVAASNLSQIRCRLIPIRGVRSRHGASANLMQPLALVRLERTLNDIGLPTVAYLDDALISGRTLRAASNLIAEHGGSLTEAVVILDRQRMPADSPVGSIATRHYWRLDIPIMGSESSCPLCAGRTMAQAFIGALASQRAKERVVGIVDGWKAVSPSFDWGRGLHPVSLGFSIDKRFSLRHGENLGDPISLTRSTGVSAWVGELHAMTCEDALALSVEQNGLDKHHVGRGVVPADALVEMLSGQVLLFGDEYSNEELQKLLLKLFMVAAGLKGRGDHTALALLTLISKSNDPISAARDSWQKALREVAATFAEMAEDLQIAMAFLLHIGAISNSDGVFRDAERLLSSRSATVASKYSQLHSEVFDFDGNQHSGPIPRVAQWAPRFNRHGLILGLNSIDKLRDLVSELETQSPYVSDEDPREFASIRADIRETLAVARELIEKSLKATETSDTELPKDASVIKVAEEILKLGRRFHGCFFTDIVVEQFARRFFEERTLARALESNRFSRTGGKDTFAFSRTMQPKEFSRSGKKCVCWDQDIVKIVTDLATNSRDRPAIEDPWSVNDSSASLWIQVEYLKEGLIIHLANFTNTALTDIRTRLRSRARTRWKHLFSLGGRVRLPQHPKGSDQVVIMSVEIPFAGFLVSDRYMNELEEY